MAAQIELNCNTSLYVPIHRRHTRISQGGLLRGPINVLGADKRKKTVLDLLIVFVCGYVGNVEVDAYNMWQVVAYYKICRRWLRRICGRWMHRMCGRWMHRICSRWMHRICGR